MGYTVLTFQDVSTLKFFHGWPLAESPTKKHQNYVLDHFDPISLSHQSLSQSFKTTQVCRAPRSAHFTRKHSHGASWVQKNTSFTDSSRPPPPHRGQNKLRVYHASRPCVMIEPIITPASTTRCWKVGRTKSVNDPRPVEQSESENYRRC